MPKRPVNNLPPGSQPWARDVIKSIESAQFDATRANMDTKNAFQTINATLAKMADQIQTLETLVSSIILPVRISNSNSSFALAGSMDENVVVTETIDVPDGYTTALVFATSNAYVLAQSVGGNVLYSRTRISASSTGSSTFSIRTGSNGPDLAQPMSPTSTRSALFEDLSGGTILSETILYIQTAHTAHATSFAGLDGFAVFMK